MRPENGSQFILALRFIAPVPFRVERVMRRTGLNRDEAEARVHDQDQSRANYIRQYYQADWHAPDPFHLILNTALLDQEACARLVLAASAEREQ
jgi:cytidylate kinase